MSHQVEVPGGSIYYRTQGSGPVLVLVSGGPGNADTLAALAGQLADEHTVVTYDRRGYSRSRLDDPGEQASVSRHSDDLRRVIADLGPEPAVVFGTSFGALIALDLAALDCTALAPAAVKTLVVHEPPLGQLLAGEERQPFDLDGGPGRDAGATLNAIAASVGVKRGIAGEGQVTGATGGGPRPEDVALFVRRDVPAIGAYDLDLGLLSASGDRIIVTASEEGRGFYPYRCAQRLADYLGQPLTELPGNHVGMIQHPAEFSTRLRQLLP